MLKRQNPSTDPMSFLAGDSEMARRIRGHDWTGHPLGLPETWPQALRSALGICLTSTFPTAIYWGPQLRLLYNDAWSAIPGPRHPACLGEPAAEVWSDIWPVIEPQFRHVIETGDGLSVEDQMLPMRRFGFEEETYWNYSFTPIRGEDGTIGGVFNSGNETTDKVLDQRRTGFLLALSDRLRDCRSTEATMAAACEALGRHLDVCRVGLRAPARTGDGADLPMVAEWAADAATPAAADRPQNELSAVADTLRGGRVARLTRTADIADPAARAPLEALGAAALLAVPWIEQGVLSAVLYLHADRPRNWTDDEVATAEKVLDRTVTALERDRARAREQVMAREIDHRARNLLTVVRAVARLIDAPDVAGYRQRLFERIDALSRTHSLLSSDRWTGVALRQMLEEELAPYRDLAGPTIALDGPDITLPTDLAQGLSLALHELVTNAAKHGALRTPEGRLTVRWQVLPGDLLSLSWNETGGTAAAAEDAGATGGFGTRLLTLAVEAQLGGRLSRRFGATGLSVEMQVPLAAPATKAIPGAGSDSAGPDSAPDAPRRILVLEDDPLVAMDLADTLRDLGHDVVATCHGVDKAMAALDRDQPDFAVLDVNLGSGSSAPVARALDARGIPFLILSGYEADDAQPAVFAGRPRVLKPFSQAALERGLQDAAGAPPRPA